MVEGLGALHIQGDNLGRENSRRVALELVVALAKIIRQISQPRIAVYTKANKAYRCPFKLASS